MKSISVKEAKRAARSKWLLLAVSIYFVLCAILTHFAALPQLAMYFSPLSAIYGYLLQWFSPLLPLLALTLLALLGYVLCVFGKSAGKPLFITVHSLLLVFNGVIFSVHMIYGLRLKQPDYLRETFYLALPAVFFSILALLLLHWWKPGVYQTEKHY